MALRARKLFGAFEKRAPARTQFVDTNFSLLTRILSRWSWQVLGSWNFDMGKCLSSSNENFFDFLLLILRLITMLKLRSWWSWCWEEIVELKIKLLKLTGKQCWRWDRFVELGIKLLVLIRIFIVEFCYNLATIIGSPSSLCERHNINIHCKS